ncbi:hypothetical protein PP175_25695 (plasmid) [Aneurinibacillus sp. Ricciae_BoGa-3]|uniref:hypothetical protein n=1 Tax=Aneurinibacillus sp. Ricciae_BoGa-3 TaxID=3022697 RepID=UPI0023403877|nr:hypothetical protein [Aneurinibacillus sp. Ricciae_BoGa-3]WCK57463.1 hypothetical protein PP175_25695 [Aneurinibacillus sp. Ricciae_BoGa-3]
MAKIVSLSDFKRKKRRETTMLVTALSLSFIVCSILLDMRQAHQYNKTTFLFNSNIANKKSPEIFQGLFC